MTASRVAFDQSDLLHELEADPESGLFDCRRVDTHMSHLFLSAGHAFKFVRAVRHPYADMTTLERRKAACEAEFAINKAFAPTLYQWVEQVVRTPQGRYCLGGKGEVVDYVVVMRRFPDNALLADLADEGHLTSPMVEDAVDALADYHLSQTAQRAGEAPKSYDRIIADLRLTACQGVPPRRIADLAASVLMQLADLYRIQEAFLDARRDAGFVRRGHGDFHLRNLCIDEGRVTPFDALAFDEALATTDVLYDLAFLLMDLRGKGLDAYATRAMNIYFDRLKQDENALALLPFFMALRAAVRMAVAVEAGHEAEATRYGRLAQRFLEPTAPRLVAIGGLSGTGKSMVARAICHLLPGVCGARLLSADAIRKQEAGLAAFEPMPASAYTEGARRAVYQGLALRSLAALAAGSSIIADATYREVERREEVFAAATPHPFLGVWLFADVGRRLERVGTRHSNASDAGAQVASAQVEPSRLQEGWVKVDANGGAAATAELVSDLIARSSFTEDANCQQATRLDPT